MPDSAQPLQDGAPESARPGGPPAGRRSPSHPVVVESRHRLEEGVGVARRASVRNRRCRAARQRRAPRRARPSASAERPAAGSSPLFELHLREIQKQHAHREGNRAGYRERGLPVPRSRHRDSTPTGISMAMERTVSMPPDQIEDRSQIRAAPIVEGEAPADSPLSFGHACSPPTRQKKPRPCAGAL